MSKKTGKKKHMFFIVMAVILVILMAAALMLMTHTQLIVGAIQSLSAATVNTKNLYEPLGTPMEGMKENGQYIIIRIKDAISFGLYSLIIISIASLNPKLYNPAIYVLCRSKSLKCIQASLPAEMDSITLFPKMHRPA